MKCLTSDRADRRAYTFKCSEAPCMIAASVPPVCFICQSTHPSSLLALANWSLREETTCTKKTGGQMGWEMQWLQIYSEYADRHFALSDHPL